MDDCVDASIQELEEYIKKIKERLITVARYRNGNIKPSSKMTKTRKQILEKKTTIIEVFSNAKLECQKALENWGINTCLESCGTVALTVVNNKCNEQGGVLVL